MPKQPVPKKRSGRRGDPLSAHPITSEQPVRGIFAIKPDDVEKMLASKPGKGKRKV
jgi:hypothetical protein